MCKLTTRNRVRQCARDLRGLARVITTPHVGGFNERLDRVIDRLEVVVQHLELGDVRAQQGATEAWHHAQLAMGLIHDGRSTGPLPERLVAQAYLRVAAHQAWKAWQVLESRGWGDGPASQREECAEVATAGGRRA